MFDSILHNVKNTQTMLASINRGGSTGWVRWAVAHPEIGGKSVELIFLSPHGHTSPARPHIRYSIEASKQLGFQAFCSVYSVPGVLLDYSCTRARPSRHQASPHRPSASSCQAIDPSTAALDPHPSALAPLCAPAGRYQLPTA
jgi:hypothetical protein